MRFEKVSFKQFRNDMILCGFEEEQLEEMYNNIKLPERSTQGSAGYDFRLPYRVFVNGGHSDLLPTGIKCMLDDDKVLMLYPRSSLGTKYGFRLLNTTGVIDADYYNNPKNEGHIMLKFEVDEEIDLATNEKIMQGIIMQYFKIDEDDVIETRNGGFGSTDEVDEKREEGVERNHG
jgi:dUTP pyrophosphatase